VSLLASGSRAAVVIIASAGFGSDGERFSAGVWTPQGDRGGCRPWRTPTRRTAGARRRPERPAAPRRSTLPPWPTTEAVDLYGADADNDGAHPLESP